MRGGGASVSSLSIELKDSSSSCGASRPFSADNFRIMTKIARILLAPSVAADDDDDELACFLVHFPPYGALNMIEVEHTAVFLYWPFAGAGERAVWKQILGCFPPACCLL